MPIYEYDCDKCGEFEVSQRITDDPLKRCPTCRGKVKKLISNTSFQLKGSGWYQTDYGSKKGDSGSADKPAASAGESASSESAGSESASSESGDKSDKSESGGKDKSTKSKSKDKSKGKGEASTKASAKAA